MSSTRNRRVPFWCHSCGLESESAMQITDGESIGAYECPRCGAVSHLERAYLSGLIGGGILGGVAGLLAIALFKCCLSDTPIVFSMLSALPVALVVVWWLRPSLSRRFDRWTLKNQQRK
jgi:hypothetical protein